VIKGTGASVKTLYEGHKDNPGRFVRSLYESLGLCDARGRRHHDRAGNITLKAPKDKSGNVLEPLRPDQFSLLEMAESMIGEDWAEQLRPDRVHRAMLMEERAPILEAGTGAVMPSAFANINAFTASVVGLIEVSMIEGWQNPQFIADQLMPAEATKVFEGRKKIGVTRMGDVAEERLPGMPTKRAQVGEKWINQPRTVENAVAVEVTQESVFLDLTGQVLKEANDLGTWLAYRKELRCIDAFIGVTNTYSYKGTAYNTYQTASTWDNSFSNELLHWTDIEEVEIKFRDMTDPETGTRVLIQPNTILVNRGKLHTLGAILGATNVRYSDATTSTHNMREFSNPIKGYTPLESPLVYQRCRDSDGLNLSAANAEKYWWTYEKGKPIVYAQNWPLRTQTAAPTQMDMIDRGVISYTKADERGVPFWQEPRRVVRCTN
jgi:hypothetical protein